MFFFQTPLSIRPVGADDFAFIDTLGATGRGLDVTEELALLKPLLWIRPTWPLLSASIGPCWVRQEGPGARRAQQATEDVPPQPLLYLDGAGDGCIGVEVAETARTMAPDNVMVEIVDGGGDFLHLEQPVAVNRRAGS